jgi:hypothetical protein
MPGGLMILVAYGYENLYLTDDPQITYFKIVYRRHTNFSIEPIPQYFNINANFSNRISCIISKNGDLINKIYVVITLPIIQNLPQDIMMRWVQNIGYVLIKTVEIEIGGKIIDKHYSDWLYIWNELNKTNNQRGLDQMIGNVDNLIKFSNTKDSYTLYVPLQFWFCKNISLSLPIISLEHSEVKINIEFEDINKCIITGPTHYIYLTDCICLFKQYELVQIGSDNSYIQYINFDEKTMKMGYIKCDPNAILLPDTILIGIESKYSTTIYNPITKIYPTILSNKEILNLTQSNTSFRNIYNLSLVNAYLLIDYIYLDSMERVKFAKSNHEYLIDIYQFDNDKIIFNTTNKIKYGYTNSTKEIIIRVQNEYMNNNFYVDPFNYTTSFNKNIAKSLIKKILIKLNGFNRELDYDKNFYTYVQSLQHHKSTPPLGIFCYSFALFPEDNQPSGSCNLSKIDDFSIDITVEPISYNKPAYVKVYALSYNVLQIVDGIARLVFNN